MYLSQAQLFQDLKQKATEINTGFPGFPKNPGLRACLHIASLNRQDVSDATDPNSVSVPDPDPGGSGFKSPVWIRIRNPDPDPAIDIELF